MMQGFGYAVGPAFGAGLFEVSARMLMKTHELNTEKLHHNVEL